MSSRRGSDARTGGSKKGGARSGARRGDSTERAKDAKRSAQPKPQASAKGKGDAKAPKAKAGGSKRSSSPSRRPAAAGPPRGGAREFSAGGVVVRGDDVVVIVPTRRAADGSRVLSLPKGHVDPGETPRQAAEREVREEAGVIAEPVRELGESRYWYRRDGRTIGKSVHFYLFSYVRGDTGDHDDEVEEARWIPLKDAERQLTYPAEREMVARAREYLKEGERKDR